MPLFGFICPKCGVEYEELFKSHERPPEIPCMTGGCNGMAEYRVGKPAMFRVKFDNNGRVGYRYDMGDGKKHTTSATRENYEHNLGNRTTKDLKEMGNDRNKSVYTKEYDRHVRTQEQEKIEKAAKELKQVIKESK